MAALTTRTPEETLSTASLDSNKGRLAAVRSRKIRQSFIYWLSNAGALLTITQGNPIALVLLSASSKAATVITKCARIEAVFEALNKEFKGTDIQLFPDIDMAGIDTSEKEYNLVDLYIRFQAPKRTQLFITIRSMGKNAVVYSEEKESLLIKRKNRDRAVVTPCPLIGLNENREWLTRNRKGLGLSSRDVTKAVTAKVLVIWGDTKIAQHRPELYSEIGKGLYLTLFKEGTKTFVVHQEDVAAFVRDWLTHIGK